MENAIRVLVIDDDEDFRISIQSLLESEGFEVACAACGREGLQLARAARPDLVILDIMMESPTEGYVVNESLKYCQEYDACKDTPIIMCSSIQNSPDELYPRAEEVAMIRPDAYLAKPLDLGLLLTTIKRLVPRPIHA
jgi:CheY-like chemotaxis protein